MMSRDTGVPGSPSGAAVRANNIEVTAAENGYTSSSVIKLDKVHVLRQSDIVQGQGITTASVSNGRGVRISVDPSGLNALGYLTTSTLRTKAGEPLYVTSHTQNYVDIGTTGGVHPMESQLTFAQYFDVSPGATESPQTPAIRIVPGIKQDTGLETRCIDIIDANTSLTIMRIDTNKITFGDGSGEDDNWGPQVGFTQYGNDRDVKIGQGAAATSAMFLSGRWNPFAANDIFAFVGEYGLFNNDVHGYDAVYSGDPLGLSPVNSIGHLRTYGNMLADPNNSVRYGTTGTINARTGGTLAEGVHVFETDTTNGGGVLDLIYAGNPRTGYPSGNPAKPQIEIRKPTYITGQFGASGDVYTSASVQASTSVNAGTSVNATTHVDAGTYLQVGVGASGSTSGHSYFRTGSGSTINELDVFTDANQANFNLINNSATFSVFKFQGNTNGNAQIQLYGQGTDRAAQTWLLSTGTGIPIDCNCS